jgi:acetyl-CoA carboxylase biotin carboxyl carrier protein
MIALVRGRDLLAPQPGYFVARVRLGDVVHAGSILGTLEVLGAIRELVAPETIGGTVVALADPQRARVAVDHGALLATLDPEAIARTRVAAPAEAAHETMGRVFRAPTSGRFYGRSAPDKAPFVAAGDRLEPGATICLLEVMKTFHRVTYRGEPVTVRAVLVADGADVNQGDPLLALDA